MNEPKEMPDEDFFEAPPSDADAPAASRARGPKISELIVRIVETEAELFHDAKHTAWAVVPSGARRAVVRLRSRGMAAWIAARARPLGCVSKAALDEALTTIEGISIHEREERQVFLRVAEADGAIVVDLGDRTGRCVEITARGWSVRDAAPVMFRRPDALRELPVPAAGGRIDELVPFVNVDEDGFRLLAAWLVGTYRIGRPYPILALYGEQGTAKSTISRFVRDLSDPNVVPVRSPPRKEDDLIVAASHSHVVSFDNLSGVPPWLSDALCRLATGGGLTKRALFTDDDEIAIEVLRPVLVNGIDEIANRADLAERCIVLELRPIPRGKRKSEREFRAAFERAAPRILGALFDGVSSALRNLDRVRVDDLPRMADFACWIAAAEEGLGFEPGSLAAAYARNRERAVDLALESSPVAVALRALLAKPSNRGRWEGEPEQLLAALNELTAEATRRAPLWPKSSASLSKSLRRAATFLRTVHVEIDLDGHVGSGAEKKRRWSIRAAEPGTTAGRQRDDSGRAADPEKTSDRDDRDARDDDSQTHAFSDLLT